MLPKKIHYIWFGKGKKPDNFYKKILPSWKKFCSDYEIIEWNENNYDISKNKYCKKFYDKKKWAFAADYARFDILNKEGGIYLDTDMEILKNLDIFLEDNFFLGYQDIFSIGGGIIGSEKNHTILKEALKFYENKKIRIILPNLLNKILKKYTKLKYNGKIIKTNKFTIYSKEYFYPYAYFELEKNMKITNNTYTIHHYDASWLPKIITKVFFPIIGIYTKFYKIKD